ncbi:MAG: MerR family transcriptional regulator [Saprospiraceae bacterium]
MAIYSIGDLAKLSGVKAHTLRVWEQRYEVLKPKRNDANVRYYDDDDVRHLLNVALLNRNGLRISQIAKLSVKELTSRVAEISEVSGEYSTQLDALTLSMLEMDEARFDRILTLNIEQLGFEQTMLTVIFPFLEKLSVLWMTGSVKPVQESFTSGLIRRKLMVAIEELPHPNLDSGSSLILFLPEGEVQEMSLLLLHYLSRKRGYQTYYLGRDISLTDLEDAYQIVKPRFVFTMITETFSAGSVADYAQKLLQVCPESTLLLSGYQAVVQPLPVNPRLNVLRSMQDTLNYLSENLEAVSPAKALRKSA